MCWSIFSYGNNFFSELWGERNITNSLYAKYKKILGTFSDLGYLRLCCASESERAAEQMYFASKWRIKDKINVHIWWWEMISGYTKCLENGWWWMRWRLFRCPVESMWLGLAAVMDDWVLCRFKHSAFNGTRHNQGTLEIFSFSLFFSLSLEAPLWSKRLLYCCSLNESWYYIRVCEL